MHGQRRVGINLLPYSPRRVGGVGTFILGVTRALLERAANEYILFVPPAYQDLWRSELPSQAALVVCGPHPDRRPLRVAYEQVRLPAVATRHRIDIIFFPLAVAPRWPAGCTVVTVPDLLLLSRRKTDIPWYKSIYLRWTYRKLARRGDHIVTISEFCRREICDKLNIPPDRITVASPGVDGEFLRDRPLSAGYSPDLPRPYLLSVAGAYPHKRLPTLLEAFELVASEQPRLHLILAGTHTGRADAIRALRAKAAATGLAARIHFLPPLPRRELPQLFAGAAALVSASDYEGFGIPVLEAMAIRCPVAAAPADAVVEVLGGCGWVATDFTPVALASVIRQALGARSSGAATLRRAEERARTVYTWEAAAAALEKVFASVQPQVESARAWA